MDIGSHPPEKRSKHDEEAYEVLLADEKLRNDFYERLNAYARTLAIALSSEQFIVSTPEQKVQAYKNDLRRFQNLKAAVKLRYADTIDYRDFAPKIKKLLDTHITASEVIRLNEPVNIFDEEAFKKVVEEHGYAKTPGAKADMIAYATKRAISERLEQDPAFYEKFSRMIQQAIDDFRARRISDLEYLQRVSVLKDAVVQRKSDDLPPALARNENAAAVFGVVKPYVAHHTSDEQTAAAVAAAAAVNIWEIIQRNKKVGFWDDLDAQRRTINDLDDYLYDEIKGVKGIALGTEEMDDIIARTMQLARHWIPA